MCLLCSNPPPDMPQTSLDVMRELHDYKPEFHHHYFETTKEEQVKVKRWLGDKCCSRPMAQYTYNKTSKCTRCPKTRTIKQGKFEACLSCGGHQAWASPPDWMGDGLQTGFIVLMMLGTVAWIFAIVEMAKYLF